jgi:hypothetical protein
MSDLRFLCNTTIPLMLALCACSPSGDEALLDATGSTTDASEASTATSGLDATTSDDGSTGEPNESDTTAGEVEDGTTEGSTDHGTTETGDTTGGSTGENTTGESTGEDTTGGAYACTAEEAAACDANASCSLDEYGDAECTCDAGWEGPGNLCWNIDECTEGTHDCDDDATCTDTPGSFDCTCNEYYFGNGALCVPIDPTTYVADVSHRPIEISIDGVGNFDIHGMGRLAVEIDYVSIPGAGYVVNRIPTDWKIHDLVIQDIEARPGSDIQNLVDWATGVTDPRSAFIHLDGLGTEMLVVTLYELTPVSVDPTVTDGQMAALVLAIEEFSHTDWGYTPPQFTATPGNSTRMDIGGIVGGPTQLPADITEAEPETADPIDLRKIGNNSSWGHAENYLDWFRTAIDQLDAIGDIERRSLSQIRLDQNLAEIDRTNCWETFPSLIYFFNPAKTYGSSYLVDITIVTQVCEHGGW